MYLYILCVGRNYDVGAELQEIQTSVDEAAAQKLSITKAFQTAEAKKGLMIAFGLMIFQQLSGVNAVIFYATDIFKVSIA
jgi:SP family facilitated glucose transporter-like MFS transporter 8